MQDVQHLSNKRVHLPNPRLFVAAVALAVSSAMAFSAEAQNKDPKPATGPKPAAGASASASASIGSSGANATASASTSADKAPPKKGPPLTGMQAGFRTGYAMPQGKFDASQTTMIADSVNGYVPFWLDIGHRILPSLYVGIYAQFGYVMIKKAGVCDSKVSHCTGEDYRLGLNIHYHFLPEGRFDPWIGLGAGYEWYHQSVGFGDWTSATAVSTMQMRGFELVNAQLGLDIKHSQQGGLGPFVAFTMSKFDKQGSSLTAQGVASPDSSGSVQNPSIHQWLMFGIQGSYYDDLF
jgi:opacity protein-like surface antigen